jgi:hypothetical protein
MSSIVGTPESERLKVTALNLFHPTASPLFQKASSFHIATQFPREKAGGNIELEIMRYFR